MKKSSTRALCILSLGSQTKPIRLTKQDDCLVSRYFIFQLGLVLVFQPEDPYLAKSASKFAHQRNPTMRSGTDLISVGHMTEFTNSSG